MAIRKEFWRLAWPAAAEGLLLMLLTAADLLMVSSLGNTAVAAVSIFSQPRMVILCVTRSYSVALSAYVARRRGEDPDESLTACSRASLMLGCGLSILLLVGTWIGAGPLLQLAGAQDDYISLALRYAFPALVSLAFSGPAIVLHGILAGLGDTKSVLVSNVLGNGVNVVFNALLIYGLGPFPKLGVLAPGLEPLSVLALRWPIRWRFSYGGGIRPLCGAEGTGCRDGNTSAPWLPLPRARSWSRRRNGSGCSHSPAWWRIWAQWR